MRADNKITGIYSSADLKQGCNITHGTYFTDNPDNVFSHMVEKILNITNCYEMTYVK